MVIPNNRIDKEVQQIFLPLNLMQILLLNPQYHIKHNFIHPNNCLNKFILISGVMTFLATYVYRIMEIILDDNFGRYRPINFLMFASSFDFSYRCIGFIMNFFISFSQTKSNVLFVLYFQEVNRFINNKTSLKRFIMRSWISVAALFGFYIFIFIYVYVVYLRPPWNVMFYILIMVTLDSNGIHAIRLIKLLTDKVVLWNIQLLLIRKNGCSKQEIGRMLEAYVHILKCYNYIVKIYQLRILYLIAEAFFQGLVHVQFLIEFFKYELSSSHYVSVFFSFWIIKNLTIQITLSLQLEAFYEAVKIVENSCEFILVTDCTVEEKKLCKNTRRLHRVSFGKMSVCGLFYIDICHPLHLLTLLTHYTIVLLQFAFL